MHASVALERGNSNKFLRLDLRMFAAPPLALEFVLAACTLHGRHNIRDTSLGELGVDALGFAPLAIAAHSVSLHLHTNDWVLGDDGSDAIHHLLGRRLNVSLEVDERDLPSTS
jgi:hypothetical protein